MGTGSCCENKESLVAKNLKAKGHNKVSSTVTIKNQGRRTLEPKKKLLKNKNKNSKKAFFKIKTTTSSIDKKFINSRIKNQNCEINIEKFK